MLSVELAFPSAAERCFFTLHLKNFYSADISATICLYME